MPFCHVSRLTWTATFFLDLRLRSNDVQTFNIVAVATVDSITTLAFCGGTCWNWNPKQKDKATMAISRGHLKPLLDFYAWSPSFFFAALFLPKTLHSLARWTSGQGTNSSNSELQRWVKMCKVWIWCGSRCISAKPRNCHSCLWPQRFPPSHVQKFCALDKGKKRGHSNPNLNLWYVAGTNLTVYNIYVSTVRVCMCVCANHL